MQDAPTPRAMAGEGHEPGLVTARGAPTDRAAPSPAGRALSDEQRRRLVQRLAARRRGDDAGELVPDPGRTAAPLSPTQEQIWLSDRIAANAAYNAPEAVHFRGPLDTERLQAALDAVAAAHAVLRTTYHLGADGRPEQ